MTSSSKEYKEYICLPYQHGICQLGKKCWYRHDEQGTHVKPAERRASTAMKAKYGEHALKTSEQWQEAEPLQYVRNSKTFHIPCARTHLKKAELDWYKRYEAYRNQL